MLNQNHVDGLLEIIVEPEHGQKVNVHEKDEGGENLAQGHVAQIIDGIKFAFAIHDVIPDISTSTQGV